MKVDVFFGSGFTWLVSRDFALRTPTTTFRVDGCHAETLACNAKFYGIMMSSDI